MRDTTSMLNRRTFVAGTGAILGAGAMGTAQASETSADLDVSERPTLVAHRGFADIHPENTVSAFAFASEGETDDAADRRRADWIELDVYPTCDGEIAVFHDEDLGDLTDTEGLVYEEFAETVFSAEVLESGQTIPTLRESMDVIPSEIGVNIDIKNGSPNVEMGRVEDPDAERKEWEWLETVVDIASEYDNELLFSTFWEGALATVREAAPEIPAAYLLADSIEEGLAVTEEYDCEAINPPLGMIQGTPFFEDDEFEDIDLVAEAHSLGVPVNVWTINTWYECERLLDVGVDGLISDYSELLRWGANQ
jgi:glycerophosphoryl diester phosphodiesterase